MMHWLESLAGWLAPRLDAMTDTLERHWMAAATVILGLAAAGYLGYLLVAVDLFWDFKIYAAAGRAWLAGDNPYNFALMAEQYGATMPAIYSPLVTDAIAHLQGVYDTTVGRMLLFALLVVSWIYLPMALMPADERGDSLHRAYYFTGYLTLFGFAGVLGLVSGNSALIISAACVASLRHWQRGGSPAWFWLTLLTLGQVKYYYLAFLIFPVLLFRRFWSTLAFLAAFSLLAATNWLLYPQAMGSYLAEIDAFTSQPGSTFIGVSMYNFLFAVLAEVLSADTAQSLASLGHLGFSGLLAGVAAIIVLAGRGRSQPELVFGWLILTVLLVSPRLLGYDLALGVVPFLVLLAAVIRAGRAYVAVALLPVVFSLGFTGIGENLARWTSLFSLTGVWLATALLLLRDINPEETTPVLAKQATGPSNTG